MFPYGEASPGGPGVAEGEVSGPQTRDLYAGLFPSLGVRPSVSLTLAIAPGRLASALSLTGQAVDESGQWRKAGEVPAFFRPSSGVLPVLTVMSPGMAMRSASKVLM